MNINFHLKKKEIIQFFNLVCSKITIGEILLPFFLFYTIYKTLLNYVQGIRFSRPENYIMFLGCHTKRNVLMSSKNNIVQLTSCYFSLCFECQNGLWDFKGFTRMRH